MVELDEFDRVYKGREKRVGFPNSSLGAMKMKSYKP